MATLDKVNALPHITMRKFLDGFKKRGGGVQVRVLLVSEHRGSAKENYEEAKYSFNSTNFKFNDATREIHYKGRHTIKFMCSHTADRDLHAPIRAGRYTHKYKIY